MFVVAKEFDKSFFFLLTYFTINGYYFVWYKWVQWYFFSFFTWLCFWLRLRFLIVSLLSLYEIVHTWVFIWSCKEFFSIFLASVWSWKVVIILFISNMFMHRHEWLMMVSQALVLLCQRYSYRGSASPHRRMLYVWSLYCLVYQMRLRVLFFPLHELFCL